MSNSCPFSLREKKSLTMHVMHHRMLALTGNFKIFITNIFILYSIIL